MRTRAFVRAKPRSPMTVAFERAGEPFAYGAVANISEGGACVWTEARFEVGEELSVRLSTTRVPQPVEAPAVVVWGFEDSERELQTHRFGLRWTGPAPEYADGIRRLLSLST